MSRFKTYIYLISFFVALHISAQETTIIQNVEEVDSQINVLINQAQSLFDDNNYFEAKDKLEKGLELAKSIDNKKQIGLILSKIGKVQYTIEEPEEARKTLVKAIEVQRFAKDNLNLAETYKTKGYVYMALKNYEQAINYFKSSKALFKQEDLHEYEAESTLNEGIANYQLGKYKKAKELLETALALSRRYDLEKIESGTLINYSKTIYKQGQLEKALEVVNKGYNIANKNGYSNLKSEAYLVLSDLNQSAGNFGIANTYLKLHINISDSLLNVKRKNSSPEKRLQLLLDNNTEYQKNELANLEALKDENKINKLTTILSIALITILSLLTLSLYKNNNIRLKTNNMLYKKNSELIMAMEKAELASKTKANFLSTVTHELRTPLYAVTGLTNMLLDENPKPEQIQHLKSLKFSGEYLLTFINDILQINKIEANKVEIEPELFNLKKKVANVISALSNSASNNNTKIHFEYDKNLPLNYNADQLKISQILINLIGNSIKFTKNGDIWVRIYKINEQNGIYSIRFEVEDNGIGISEEKQKNIFESFSQGSIQINRKYGGTGLGLSIVKGLIDILKGKIYLKNELNKGTTFYFELPMKYSDKTIKQAEPTFFNEINEVELSNIKILVVEDNKINQMITKKILTKMKLNCTVVDNGEAAVEQVKNNNYDVVLMDIHMPGISGIEATKQIRAFDKNLTIFALTAVTIEDKMQEFDEAGFTDIISKPFKQEDFEKKLYNALVNDGVTLT
ncbi:ATP-binding protein [Lacinutrix salivirga]